MPSWARRDTWIVCISCTPPAEPICTIIWLVAAAVSSLALLAAVRIRTRQPELVQVGAGV
jgi:hypothetical protein